MIQSSSKTSIALPTITGGLGVVMIIGSTRV
jgi:hypothetical protein